MKTGSISTLMLFAGLLLSVACWNISTEQQKEPVVEVITAWNDLDVLITTGKVEKSKVPGVGAVKFKRSSDGSLFYARLIPFEPIEVGSEIKVSKVNWESSSTQSFGENFYYLRATKVVKRNG